MCSGVSVSVCCCAGVLVCQCSLEKLSGPAVFSTYAAASIMERKKTQKLYQDSYVGQLKQLLNVPEV